MYGYLFRLFFQKLPERCMKYPAKFTDVAINSLSDFQALRDKNLDWARYRMPYRIKNSKLPLAHDPGMTLPPLKKSKKV